jgi:uncharacterized RDD family membrane protein YckC
MHTDEGISRAPPAAAQPEGRRFGPRAIAYIVDVLLVNILDYSFGYVGGAVFFGGLVFVSAFFGYEPALVTTVPTTVYFLVGVALSVVYFACFEALYGASPGKLILRMRVSTRDGARPSFLAALTRGVWRLIDGLFFGLVAASAMKPPLRQRYGDKRAGTLVVDSHSPILKERPSPLWLLPALLLYVLASLTVQLFLLLVDVRFQPIR